MFLRNVWLQKTCLPKSLKGPVLVHPYNNNVFTVLRHCWNMHNSTFFDFAIVVREIKIRNFSLSQMWNLKTVLLTHWFQMIIYILSSCKGEFSQSIQMQSFQNQKNFLNFCQHFGNLRKISNTFKKTLSLTDDFLLKL